MVPLQLVEADDLIADLQLHLVGRGLILLPATGDQTDGCHRRSHDHQLTHG